MDIFQSLSDQDKKKSQRCYQYIKSFMPTIDFVKITAAGNDFVMIDNLSGRRNLAPSAIKKICDRKFGIGADGVIFLEKSADADFKMRYFNSDGSRASMCGNGARSIVRFARLVGAISKNKGCFRSDAGLIGYEFVGKGDIIKVELTQPRNTKIDFPLLVGGKKLNVSFINTGVPHTVIFFDENRRVFGKSFDDMDITAPGRAIRFHKKFSPEGTNVNFVKVVDRSKSFIKVRTYERGVEDETLACGTGVTASAIISGMKKLILPPIKILTRGGEILEVDYDVISPTNKYEKIFSKRINRTSPHITNVRLAGPAKVVFKGCISV